MLANITLASIAKCMKFKLLYDDWVRMYVLKCNNQPVITSFHEYDYNNNYKKKYNKIIKEKNNNNDNVANEYEIELEDEDNDENDSKISIDFTSTFTKFFHLNQLKKTRKGNSRKYGKVKHPTSSLPSSTVFRTTS
jgi:membrane-bound lytic murein transglycosylase